MKVQSDCLDVDSKAVRIAPPSPTGPDVHIIAPTPSSSRAPFLPYSLPVPATQPPPGRVQIEGEAFSTSTSKESLPAWLPNAIRPSPQVQVFISRNVGLLFVASSQIFFVGMGLTAKYFVSTTEISTLLLILVRMIITAACCIAWLLISGDSDFLLGPPGVRKWLIWRGVFGFGGLASNYQSLRGLSVSDSVTIQFLAPNLTALLGFVVLGETLGWREVVAGLTCLGGVLLVSRPPFLFGQPSARTTSPHAPDDSHPGAVIGIPEEGGDAGVDHPDRMVAVTWAFVAVLSASCAYITIRKIGKQAHAMHSMLYFCYFCVAPCVLGLLLQINSFVFIQSWKEFWLIMLIGVFGFTGQMLLTFGLQREKAGRASVAMYLSIFYSIFLELLIFGTIPPFLSLLGAAVIITSAIWVALNKQQEPTTSPASESAADEDAIPLSHWDKASTKRAGGVTYSALPTAVDDNDGVHRIDSLEDIDSYDSQQPVASGSRSVDATGDTAYQRPSWMFTPSEAAESNRISLNRSPDSERSDAFDGNANSHGYGVAPAGRRWNPDGGDSMNAALRPMPRRRSSQLSSRSGKSLGRDQAE